MGILGNRLNDDARKMMNEASDENTSSGRMITHAGKYLVRVRTSKYKNKNGDIKEYPNISESSKKSILLNFILEIVDGTKEEPAGNFTYGMLVLLQAPGATEEKIRNTMRITKPRIKVMVGDEIMKSFDFTEEWIEENLLAKFQKKGNGYVVTKDHNMKEEFVITLEEGMYNDKPTLNISKYEAKPEDFKSITTGPSIEEVVEEDGGVAPTGTDPFGSTEEGDFADKMLSEPSGSAPVDDDLPF